MRTSTATGKRLMMQIAAGVLAVCMTCGVARGVNYTYGENGEFGSRSITEYANNNNGSKLNSLDDSISIRFTALEDVAIDRVFLRYYANGSATFTVGIMADDGAGKPDGTFLVSKATNFTFVGLTAWMPEIVFDASLNLSNGSVYHIVTRPDSIQTTMDLRTYYSLTASGIRAFDRAFDDKLNVLLKLDGGSWLVKNWGSVFVLGNGSSTGFVTGPGQPYSGIFTANALPMTGGSGAKARGQRFVITDREIPVDAHVSVTQVVVRVDLYSGTVTNNLLVQLRDTDASLTLLGATVLPNSQLDDTAHALAFPTPVPLMRNHTYLLTFEFDGAPPAAITDKVTFEEGRTPNAAGWGPVTWGGTSDCVIVQSGPDYDWTTYTAVTLDSDLWFSLMGRVVRNAGGTTLLIR